MKLYFTKKVGKLYLTKKGSKIILHRKGSKLKYTLVHDLNDNTVRPIMLATSSKRSLPACITHFNTQQRMSHRSVFSGGACWTKRL
jgi:hypothetical protein